MILAMDAIGKKMNKEKILITGSAGYIGSCLNNFLKKKSSTGFIALDKNKPNKFGQK